MLVKKSSNECEQQPEVNYVIAIGTNKQLKLRASDVISKAQHEYGEKLAPITELIDRSFEKNEDAGRSQKISPNFNMVSFYLLQNGKFLELSQKSCYKSLLWK